MEYKDDRRRQHQSPIKNYEGHQSNGGEDKVSSWGQEAVNTPSDTVAVYGSSNGQYSGNGALGRLTTSPVIILPSSRPTSWRQTGLFGGVGVVQEQVQAIESKKGGGGESPYVYGIRRSISNIQ